MINERRNFRVPIHVDIPADQNTSPTLKRFGTTLVKSMNLKKNQVIFDSGASTCATSDTSLEISLTVTPLKHILRLDPLYKPKD